MEFKVWSIKCGVWTGNGKLKCGVESVECKVCGGECEV